VSPVEPSPHAALRGRFFSLKWKTLALVSLVLAVIHCALVFQAYYEQISQFEARQALTFERQVTVLQKLLGQSEARLQRIGSLVPGILNSMMASDQIEEQWAGVQIELQLETMQLYDAQGQVRIAGVNNWNGKLPVAIGTRIADALSNERPRGFILCEPVCIQYALVPVLGRAGEHQLMLLGSSLADLVLEFPGLTGAAVALLTQTDGGGARYWEHYRLDAISDAPSNEPKLRTLAEQASLAGLDQGQTLYFGGRSYRFYSRPLETFGGVTPGHFLVFADTTQALADIRAQLLRQLLAGLIALLAALILLLLVLNRPMNQLRKLARALPMLAQHQYEPARQLIGTHFQRTLNHSEIEVLEAVSVDLARQLEELERTVAARSSALAQSLADLKRANELNEKIFATAPMVILIQSAEGHVLQMNEFGSQLLGYSAAEARGMSYVALLADPRQREEAMTVLVDVIGGRRMMFEQTGPVRCVDDSLERITWLHTRLAAQGGVFVLSVGLPDKSLELLPTMQ
jgi:PAS domain S-box-containing protein